MQAIADLTRADRYLGALRSVSFAVSGRQQPIPQADFDSAWSLIDFLYSRDVGEVEAIKRAVIARYKGVTMQDLRSIRRDRTIVTARHMAQYIAREITSRSFPEIGRQFSKDHTTVIEAFKRFRRRMFADADLAQTVAEIIIEVQGQSA